MSRADCLSLVALALALSSCGREHVQQEGVYALTIDKVVRDDCNLASHPDLVRRAELFVSGEVVRIDYSLFDINLVGSYLEEVERFSVDGSTANLNATVGGKECLLDLATVHLDATTQDPDTFSGNLSVRLEAQVQTSCACELWVAYTARRQP